MSQMHNVSGAGMFVSELEAGCRAPLACTLDPRQRIWLATASTSCRWLAHPPQAVCVHGITPSQAPKIMEAHAETLTCLLFSLALTVRQPPALHVQPTYI